MIGSDLLARSASADAELERRLRAMPPAPGPHTRFRNELRTQLVAAAERRPAEAAAPKHAKRAHPGVHRAPGRFRIAIGSRALAVAGAVMAVLLVVSGTAFYLSQRALPGDALYGLKRASESVDLSTKDGDESRGTEYLSLSTTRIDEAAALLERATSSVQPGPSHARVGLSASEPISPHTDQLVRGVLVDGDTSAITATRLLTTASVTKRAMQPTDTVATWLSGQRGKVHSIVAELPETAPATAGGAARTLQRDLSAIQTRIHALTSGLTCRTCTFDRSDRLGPLPCTKCPTAKPAPPRPRAPATTPARSRLKPGPTEPSVPTSVDPTTPVPVPTHTGGAPTSTPPPPPPPPKTTVPPTTPTAPPTTPNPTTPAPTTTDPLPSGPTTVPVPTDAPSCVPVLCINNTNSSDS